MADSLTAPKILQAPTRVGTGTLAANVKVLALRVGVAAGTEVEVDAQATYQLISVPAGVMVLAVLASILAGEAYAHGKKYLAADTIDAVIAGATPAAGLMELLLVYLDATEGTT